MNAARGHALITGAARRIGRTVALTLARAGWNITAHYNNSSAQAASLAEEIQRLGQSAALVQADLEKTKGIETIVGALHDSPVTALIHNASLFQRDAQDPTGTRHRRVNLEAPLLLTEKFFDQLPQEMEGSVIFMLDNTYLPPTFNHYKYSRAALCEAVFDLALLYAPRLQVNALALGPTLKGERESDAHFDRLVEATPLQRPSAPEDVAETILFLVKNKSITGQILNVDSGAHLLKL